MSCPDSASNAGNQRSISEQGQEVFGNYGNKSNEELILSYGFALPSNAADFFHIALGVLRPNSGTGCCLRRTVTGADLQAFRREKHLLLLFISVQNTDSVCFAPMTHL